MKAATVLTEEHKVIKKVIECLGKLVEETKAQGKLDADAARKLVRFFREFSDRCHHSKEEERLFPAMEAAGIARAGGPLGVMMMDHESGRNYVRGMDHNIDEAAAGDPKSVSIFCSNARGFAEILSEHIEKEDHCLYPMAATAMGPEKSDALYEEFLKIEKEKGGARIREGIALAKEICERFGVDFVSDAELETLRSDFGA